MSATAVREKFQVTLPQDVREAAGLRVNDQVEWRFEAGEIRGRKLVQEKPRRVLVKPVKRHGMLILPLEEGELDSEALDREMREERESENARLLG